MMVSLATILQMLTVLATSFADLINSLISPSLTCVLFSCSVLVVTLLKISVINIFMFLFKISILLEEDNMLLLQYSSSKTSFSSLGGCKFVILCHL